MNDIVHALLIITINYYILFSFFFPIIRHNQWFLLRIIHVKVRGEWKDLNGFYKTITKIIVMMTQGIKGWNLLYQQRFPIFH